jgi:hypothetical protein
MKLGLLRVPVPLTGTFALRAGAPETQAEWTVAFFEAIAEEAADYSEMLRALERGWLQARARIGRRRSNSRAEQAVDLLAAAPLLSATTLSRAIGMSNKCAGELLAQFCADGIVVEVTHRSARRLFGLEALAPLREAVRPPYRPDPNRGPGRPRETIVEAESEAEKDIPKPPSLSPLERRNFDYTALQEAMAHLDDVVRTARRTLQSPDLACVPNATLPLEMPLGSGAVLFASGISQSNEASTFRAAEQP